MPSESVAFSGIIGEVIHTEKSDGRVFERYRRPPGTRIIIVNGNNEILMTKEHRHESSKVDLRLPGGKVFDTMQAMNDFMDSNDDINEAIISGATAEAREEAGIMIRNPMVIEKAVDGATVEWDLYYVLVTDFEEHPEGQQLEAGEEGIETVWMSIPDIKAAIKNGDMHEWRSVGILLGKVIPSLSL